MCKMTQNLQKLAFINEHVHVTIRASSKRRNCLQKHFHSLNRASQERKKLCIWYELRNKTQVGVWVHWTSQWVQHSVHWGINPPSPHPQNTTPLFFAWPSLKSVNCPSPPFSGNSTLYLVFLWTSLLKIRFFNEPL